MNTDKGGPEKPRQPRQPSCRQSFPDPAGFARPFFSTRTAPSADGNEVGGGENLLPRRREVVEAGLMTGKGVPDRCESTPRDSDELMSMRLIC